MNGFLENMKGSDAIPARHRKNFRKEKIMPIEKEKFTADDAERLFCQVRNIEEAAEAAKIFIECTSPPDLEGESFFNMTERTLLQSLIEYQRLYRKPQPHKMICQSVYELLTESCICDPAYQDWVSMRRILPKSTAEIPAPMSKLDKRFRKAEKKNKESEVVASYKTFKAASGIMEDSVYISLMQRFQHLLSKAASIENCCGAGNI